MRFDISEKVESVIESSAFTSLNIWNDLSIKFILSNQYVRYSRGTWHSIEQVSFSDRTLIFVRSLLFEKTELEMIEVSAVSSISEIGTEIAWLLVIDELLNLKNPFDIARTTPDAKAKLFSKMHYEHFISDLWETLKAPPL